MAVEKFGASERFACKVIGQNRSAFRKKKPDMGFEEMRIVAPGAMYYRGAAQRQSGALGHEGSRR